MKRATAEKMCEHITDSMRTVMKAWDESLHPRDENGQFTANGGSDSATSSAPNKITTYEELLSALSPKNREVEEEVEEMMQMLSPADVGKKKYKDIQTTYQQFSETADPKLLRDIAQALDNVTGGNLAGRVEV